MNLILKLFSLKTIWDACFSWLFRMSVPDEYFGCLFQMTVARLRMTVSDYCSRRIFQILVSNDFSGWLFVIPRLIRILAANPYFHGQFLFQTIIRLIGPTTDSFLNDSFLLQNYGRDSPFFQKQSHIFSFNRVQKQSLISFKSSHAFIKKH